MADKLQCPYCGRKLPAPSQAGLVKCDGCKCPFDPSKLRYRPASFPRRVAGWVLLAVGAYLLLSGLSAALKYDYRAPVIAIVMRLLGTFLLPAFTIAAGAALKRGKMVLDVSPSDAGPQPIGVVSASEAAQIPYPYVYVNPDGTVRELHPKERQYLETPFHPADGARPYVKPSYDARNGWGDIEGFCPRSAIPEELRVSEAPAEDPTRTRAAEDLIERITRHVPRA